MISPVLPASVPQPVSSIYKHLNQHKRMQAGIGLRFNNSTSNQHRNEAIREAEEDQDEDNEIREDKEESEEDCSDEENESNDEESEDPEDSR